MPDRAGGGHGRCRGDHLVCQIEDEDSGAVSLHARLTHEVFVPSGKCPAVGVIRSSMPGGIVTGTTSAFSPTAQSRVPPAVERRRRIRC